MALLNGTLLREGLISPKVLKSYLLTSKLSVHGTAEDANNTLGVGFVGFRADLRLNLNAKPLLVCPKP